MPAEGLFTAVPCLASNLLFQKDAQNIDTLVVAVAPSGAFARTIVSSRPMYPTLPMEEIVMGTLERKRRGRQDERKEEKLKWSLDEPVRTSVQMLGSGADGGRADRQGSARPMLTSNNLHVNVENVI